MTHLDKASLITAGRRTGKVIAVVVTLPVVIVSAVLEGEIGPITKGIIFKSTAFGGKVGEIVGREAPGIVQELSDLLQKARKSH